MKKKLLIISIVLIILVPIISHLYQEVTTPDKVLTIGYSTDGQTIESKKDIEDQEKIVEYENLMKTLEFTKTEWEPDHYSDYILRVDYFKEGIATAYIWFDEGQNILYRPSTPDKNFARLTDQQVSLLKDIIE